VKWVEVSVEVEPEIAEAVADVFGRAGRAGTAIAGAPDRAPGSRLTVLTYLPDDDSLPAARQRLRESMWHLGRIRPVPEPSFRVLEDEDWAEAWKRHYVRLNVGERLVIIPSWDESDPGERLPVYLDPGMAFGTGAHPSTRLCLLALEKEVRPEDLVVDLGCGSGVLAIAAARLGAGRVLACDIDPIAVDATRSGAVRNGVEPILEVFRGSLAETNDRLDRPADLVVANILASVLTEMLPAGLAGAVRPEGTLILSGILADQSADVVQAAASVSLRLTAREMEEDWVALVLKKNAAPGGAARGVRST
jgi:ribosomal protein L11 methyltransferase